MKYQCGAFIYDLPEGTLFTSTEYNMRNLMINEFVDIRIKQTSANEFDVKIQGNAEDLLKAFAGAVVQVVDSVPVSSQQFMRTRLLHYLNQATKGE